MNYQKYLQSLLHYHYEQGDAEELDDLLLVGA
jgi:hypothetical protein